MNMIKSDVEKIKDLTEQQTKLKNQLDTFNKNKSQFTKGYRLEHTFFPIPSLPISLFFLPQAATPILGAYQFFSSDAERAFDEKQKSIESKILAISELIDKKLKDLVDELAVSQQSTKSEEKRNAELSHEISKLEQEITSHLKELNLSNKLGILDLLKEAQTHLKREERKYDALSAELTTSKEKLTLLKQELNNLKTSLKNEQERMITQNHEALQSKLSKLSAEELAHLYAKSYNNPKATDICQIISKLEMNNQYLAYLAVTANDYDLLNQINLTEIDPVNYHINDKSLFNLALEKGSLDILVALINTPNFVNSISSLETLELDKLNKLLANSTLVVNEEISCFLEMHEEKDLTEDLLAIEPEFDQHQWEIKAIMEEQNVQAIEFS